MWDYNDVVMDHFRNPRNVGAIENPDGEGLVGSMACGDALKLMFKLDESRHIADVKFQTFGCASAIASSSALTEMIKGKSLEEAGAVTNKEIADYLGGLPDQKMHCSVMGKDALLAAIDNYKAKKSGTVPEDSPDKETDITCVCFGVTQPEIERAIRENHLGTIEEVTNYTKAGGGCGGCHDQIDQILVRVNAEMAKEQIAVKPKRKKLTNIQKIQLIQETIEREIRPSLQKDGGDIELVDLDGDNVIVSLRGTCATCKVAGFTLANVVETKLREFVSEAIKVIEADSLEEEA
jgi:NifU-like protein